MKKLVIILSLFSFFNCFTQETLSDKTIIIRKYFHPSLNGGFYRIKKVENYRILSFDARFNLNCNYDLGNNHQNSWSKLMKVSPTSVDGGKRHSNRLGWRYNLETEQIETALLLHINHPIYGDNHTENGLIGHYIFPIHATDLNVFNEVELIFDDALMVNTVEDKSVIVKEQFFTEVYKTGIKRNAYFGGTQVASQDMSFRVKNIKVDYPPIRFKQSDEKHFFRCKFYNGDKLSYYAEDKIIAASYNSQSQPKNSFFIAEAGSDVTLISANEIVLDSNTHIQAGASFHAKIESCSDIEVTTFPTAICNGDNLNFTTNATSYELNLETLSGQSVFENSGVISNNTLSIDIPNLATAYYILRITFESPCDIKSKLYYIYVSSCTPPLAKARIYTPPADSSSVLTKQLLEEGLSIYPNPTHENIQVVGSETGEYILTDLYGRELFQGKKTQTQIELDLSELPNGVYIFSINGGSYRVVKQ